MLYFVLAQWPGHMTVTFPCFVHKSFVFFNPQPNHKHEKKGNKNEAFDARVQGTVQSVPFQAFMVLKEYEMIFCEE